MTQYRVCVIHAIKENDKFLKHLVGYNYSIPFILHKFIRFREINVIRIVVSKPWGFASTHTY